MSATPDPRAHLGSTTTANGPRAWRARFSGLRVHAEECPDAGRDSSLKALVGGGALGWGLSAILGATRAGRILGALAGAATGAALGRFHLRADWDPDQARAEGLGPPVMEGPGAEPGPGPDPTAGAQ